MNSRRRASALIGLAAAVVLIATPGPTGAMPGSNTDPDDVSLKLDLKSTSHTNDGSTVTYIAETYENFTDKLTEFKWGIDTNGDESFDLIVVAEWDGTDLVAEVGDAAENLVAEATVSRPAPNAIKVSIPVSVLGGATAYRYGVSAEEDLNGNGESDPGEQDLAPDTGLYDHNLSSAPGGSRTPTGGGAPVAAPAPLTAPAPAPAPRPAPVAVPESPKAPMSGTPATPVPAPMPAVVPGPATAAPPKAAAGSLSQEVTTPQAAPDAASTPTPAAPAPVAEAPSALARTGSADGLLALLAGLALVAAGFMFFAETLVPTAKPRV